VSSDDQRLWDDRHRQSIPAPVIEPPPPPPLFAHVADHFPTKGHALDIACGRGEGAVWLASRGLDYRGVDFSPVAIEMARQLVSNYPYADRCRFEVWDLDDGLPPGDQVDLLFCHMFRARDLYEPMIERVVPGGLIARWVGRKVLIVALLGSCATHSVIWRYSTRERAKA
jgi:trans-aconitate methyltransferase